jgi:hypothetical protein
MIKSNDFERDCKESLFPVTIELIKVSASQQGGDICGKPDNIILVVIRAIKFINHHFKGDAEFETQKSIVGLIFQGIESQWKSLLLNQHPKSTQFFQAICKLFKTVLKEWSPKVYTGIMFVKGFAIDSKGLYDNSDEDLEDTTSGYERDQAMMSRGVCSRMDRLSKHIHIKDMMRQGELGPQPRQPSGYIQMDEQEVQFSDTQLDILSVFDQILMISVELFAKVDNVKMQTLIVGQFQSYQEMILRLMNTDRFNPQLETMIGLALQRIRYPDWFEVDNGRGDGGNGEDQEKYLELRQELSMFIEGFMQQEHFVRIIMDFLDQRIQTVTQLEGSPQLDIRDIDLVFKLLSMFS